MSSVFPQKEWQVRPAGELRFDPEKLGAAESWMGSFGEPFRVVIVRHGYLAAEWNRGVEAHQQLRMASAVKSAYS